MISHLIFLFRFLSKRCECLPLKRWCIRFGKGPLSIDNSAIISKFVQLFWISSSFVFIAWATTFIDLHMLYLMPQIFQITLDTHVIPFFSVKPMKMFILNFSSQLIQIHIRRKFTKVYLDCQGVRPYLDSWNQLVRMGICFYIPAIFE